MVFPVVALAESNETSLSPISTIPYLNPFEAKSYKDRQEIFSDGKQIGVV